MQTKHILIVSDDLVGKKMAGPGVRNWELARALVRAGLRVTLASPSLALDPPPAEEAVELIGYERGGDTSAVEAAAATADVVMVHGFALHFLPFLREAGKPLVVDVYNPFTLEDLPRKAEGDLDTAVDDFLEYQRVLNEQLRSGDFFLCASEKQRDYWIGLLTANQRVNPHTYAADPTLRSLIDVLPFGISSTPPHSNGPVLKSVHPAIPADSKLLLWAGGIWDWFDPLTLVRAMPLVLAAEPRARLFFMGTRHPNAVVPPSARVDEAIALSRELGLLDSTVFFNNWVAYDQRAAYLLEADLGTSLHRDHLETRFSFRTRLLDYMWAGLPMVISGGDSISQFVAEHELGRVLPLDPHPQQVAEAVLTVLHAPREQYAARFAAVQPQLGWDRVAAPLVAFAQQPRFAADHQPAAARYPTAAERVRTDLERNLAAVIEEKDAFTQQVVAEKDAFTQQVVAEKDAFTEQVISGKDEVISGLQASVAEQQAYTERAIAGKDAVIAGLQASVAEQQTYTERAIIGKDALIAGLQASVVEQQAYTAQVIRDKDAFLAEVVRDRDEQIANLTRQLAALNDAVASLRAEAGWRAGIVAQQEAELASLRRTVSGRLLGVRRRVASLRPLKEQPVEVPPNLTLDQYVSQNHKLQTPVQSPFVSIVVVNYNGRHFLDRCLSSLAADVLDYPADSYEVVLVDNASRDGSVEYVQQHYPNVRIVANATNLAFAAGNNQIMQHAPGEFVVLLNNDTRVERGWLRELIAAADRHPHAAALTSKLIFYYRRVPLTIEASSFNPHALGQSADGRDLGVIVQSISVDADPPPLSGVEYGPGFYDLEGEGDHTYRWTAATATANLPFERDDLPLAITVRFNPSRPDWAGPLHLRLRVGDHVLYESDEPSDGTIRVTVPIDLLRAVPETIQNTGSLLLPNGSGRDRGAVVVGTTQTYAPDSGQYEREEQVFAFCGAAVLLRTAVLREVGYFDDSFFMYYEDIDLSWRLRLAGWEVWYVPGAVVHHVHAGSSKQWSPFFTYHATRNRLYVVAKLAPARLARREWRGFIRHTLANLWRAYPGGEQPLRPQAKLQARVVKAMLTSLPRLLRQRRQIKSRAHLNDKQIMQWTKARKS